MRALGWMGNRAALAAAIVSCVVGCGEASGEAIHGSEDAGAPVDDGGAGPELGGLDSRVPGVQPDLAVEDAGSPPDLSGAPDLDTRQDLATPVDMGPALSLVASFQADTEQPLVGWLDVEGSEPFAWSLNIDAPLAPGMPRRSLGSGGELRARWTLPVLGFPEATELFIGLRGRSGTGATAEVSLSARTGSLEPMLRPRDPELVVTDGATLGGYVLLGMILPDLVIYFAVDGHGSIVWHYVDRAVRGFATPLIRPQADGTFALLLPGEVRVIRPTGETVRRIVEPPGEAFHHDFQILPSGNLLVLSYEDREVDLGDEGLVQVLGDTIVELDSAGREVARWSSIEHLDPTRFPGELSRERLTTSAAEGRDWTHGNAIHFNASDGTVLYSPRHQNQLVHLSWPRGEVLAIYGDDGDYALEPGGSWFYSQHAPMWSGPDQFLVYDNGNERPVDSAPYSRVVEYRVDRETRRAREVFAWRTPFYTSFVGDVDVLPSGRLLVTSGVSDDAPGSVYEVDRSGRTRWGVRLPGGNIYRSEWLASFPLR